MIGIKELFGKRIKELRKEKNLTQEQLAEMINIDPRNIIKIENAQTFPRIQTLEKIVEVLEVNISDIFRMEHLNNKTFLMNKIINKLDNDEELLRLVYKMLF
ncbi:MAG: helix-turn-helix domain-containing protein [Candidatus Gastranaerophilales bacterium]|nr:helix-turn-helix domain-containing protein [Candidatus Gastranaerophilales bacterium]